MSSTWDWIGLYKVPGWIIVLSVQLPRHILVLGFIFRQVGFKSSSDYETFLWVREDELPEMSEAIQVRCQRGLCDAVYGPARY